MKTKICTSIEQSKRLIELCLDVSTADMCWSIDIPDLPTLFAYPITDCDNWENKIPAWSLTALLRLMPNFNMFKRTIECRIEITSHLIDKACDPIDAAFEMVVWLKENNKI